MQGGTERILRQVWTSVIEDSNSLNTVLVFANKASDDEMAAFHRIFGADATPDGLIIRFLSGTGIPDETTWARLTDEGQLQELPDSEDEI